MNSCIIYKRKAGEKKLEKKLVDTHCLSRKLTPSQNINIFEKYSISFIDNLHSGICTYSALYWLTLNKFYRTLVYWDPSETNNK